MTGKAFNPRKKLNLK